MRDRIPIVLLVDDACPLVHIYRVHRQDVHKKPPLTDDGRPLLDVVPNDFLDRFCDVVLQHGMAGKLSIIPAPAGRGDVVQGITGFDPQLTRQWLDTARTRLAARFDFCPEVLTHNLAVNVSNGAFLDEGESDWSQTQTRETLTPYLIRALDLLKQAGVSSSGITSCWVFGQDVEAEYIAAIVAAQKLVYNHDFSWYYLHIWHSYPDTRPYVAYARDGSTLVSINSTIDDLLWETINNPRSDAAYVTELADRYLTADGRAGAIRTVLDAGGWPILMTHWQSFFANGLETGLAVLDEVGRRVSQTLADDVEWCTCSHAAQRTVAGWRLVD